MPHGYRGKLLWCLSDWIPIQNFPSSTLSIDIQLSKTGRPAARHSDRQTARQACWGLFFFCCWRMLSAWIRLGCSSWASAASQPSPLFSMETCPTLALWLAPTLTRHTFCPTIPIIMALRKGWEQGRSGDRKAFFQLISPSWKVASSSSQDSNGYRYVPAHGMQLVYSTLINAKVLKSFQHIFRIPLVVSSKDRETENKQ